MTRSCFAAPRDVARLELHDVRAEIAVEEFFSVAVVRTDDREVAIVDGDAFFHRVAADVREELELRRRREQTFRHEERSR